MMKNGNLFALFMLTTLLLSACNLPSPTSVESATPILVTEQSPPDSLEAVPTAPQLQPTEDPILDAGPGTVSGQLCYPSNFIPPMTLHFLNLDNDEMTSVEHNSGLPSYSQSLPAGTYHAFAFRSDAELNGGGGYTDYIACGAQENCDGQDLHPFNVPANGQVTEIDICDWVIPADQLPEVRPSPDPGENLAPAPTAAAPPNGISLNCDGTYQRLRIVDNGPDGKTVYVDDWQGGAWVNVWSKTPEDPFLQRVLDEAGWYQFDGCQKLILVPIQNGDPRVTLDLTIHAWNGNTMTQVYSNSGWYGSWTKIGETIRTREASKLGYVDGGPLSACQWLTLEYEWDGNNFSQIGSGLENVENCEIAVTDHP